MVTVEARNKQQVRHYLDAWKNDDPDALDAVLVDGFPDTERLPIIALIGPAWIVCGAAHGGLGSRPSPTRARLDRGRADALVHFTLDHAMHLAPITWRSFCLD
ncbi:MAG: hypothetical protein ABEL51_06175 [Salinibacter sp.]